MEKIKETIYEIFKDKKISENTKKQYSLFISQFLTSIQKELSEIKEEDLFRFIQNNLKEKSKNTKKLAIISISMLYSFLNKPLNKQELKKEMFQSLKSTKKNLLSKDEISKIIRGANTEKSKIILCLLYSTGIKIQELINLKKEDFDFDGCEARVKLENGNTKILILTRELSEAIQKFSLKKKENFYLFSKEKPLTPRNIQKIVKMTSLKAGIKTTVTPGVLRTSFAKHLFDDGISIQIIKKITGYKSLTFLVPKNQEKLKNNYQKNWKNEFKNPLDKIIVGL